jgi:hypothetical protein
MPGARQYVVRDVQNVKKKKNTIVTTRKLKLLYLFAEFAVHEFMSI